MNTPKRTSFAAIGCSLLLAVGLPFTAGAQLRELNAAEIEEALNLGAHEEPEPYEIPGDWPEVSDQPIFALAYTPFLRVQFAAHKHWFETGGRLTVGEVSASVLAPVVHLAMWQPDEWDGPPCVAESPRVEVFMKGEGTPLRIPWKEPPPSGIPPLWLKLGLDTLAAYGAAPRVPSNGHWIVVAYPIEYLRSDLAFFLTKGDGGPGSCLLRGSIPPDELSTWR